MFPAEVCSGKPLDTGAGAPQVSIVPANAEPERTHVKASAIKNRFIICCS
jgi:hypothetical protein